MISASWFSFWDCRKIIFSILVMLLNI
jgi:hypothetical protein